LQRWGSDNFRSQIKAINYAVLLSFIFISCRREIKPITGVYQSKTYKHHSFLEKLSMYLRNESIIVGQVLVILPDSTYYLKTCGSHIAGKWKIKEGDTLLLFCERIRLRNDSLNKIEKPTCWTEPAKYCIKDGELQSWFYYEGEKVYDDLSKHR